MSSETPLAHITGSVDPATPAGNEYLVMKTRLLRHQITGRVRLANTERKTLATIGKKLGRQELKEVASLLTPNSIFAWHRKLVAQKFDGSRQSEAQERPKGDQKLESLVVRPLLEHRCCAWMNPPQSSSVDSRPSCAAREG